MTVLETQRGATESGSELRRSSSSVLFGRCLRPNPPLPRCCYPLSLFYATYMLLFSFICHLLHALEAYRQQ
jgi:hypothetical protein